MRLVDIKTLSAETSIPERTLRSLYAQRKIPYTKLGWRTLKFNPERVASALAKLEVQAVS